MIRKYARERREYLYRKSLAPASLRRHSDISSLQSALSQGKPIPTELKSTEAILQEQIKFEDAETAVPHSHIDDEYAKAGIEDPKILITTCRDPSSRLAQFAKELKLLFPNSERINRGSYVVRQIVRACINKGMTDLIIAHEHRGEPDGLIICHLPFGPTAYFGLHNTVMRHDIAEVSKMSEAYPHLIFHNFNSNLGARVSNILKYLFPVPKIDSKRVLTFANNSDYISFRHHVYEKDGKEIALKEVGPRFEMKLYKIKLGTVDQMEAEDEWALRPYMNTARKREAL